MTERLSYEQILEQYPVFPDSSGLNAPRYILMLCLESGTNLAQYIKDNELNHNSFWEYVATEVSQHYDNLKGRQLRSKAKIGTQGHIFSNEEIATHCIFAALSGSEDVFERSERVELPKNFVDIIQDLISGERKPSIIAVLTVPVNTPQNGAGIFN